MCVSAFLVGLCVAAAAGVSDEEFSSLPRLFHLDEYETCLAPRAGLYCLGTFQLEEQQSAAYSLLKEYSRDPLHFNYTFLHRGYCVSARCPHSSSERNATLRFDRCAQQWARSRGLRLHLQTLHYCHTHDGVRRGINMDLPQLVFLIVVATLLAMNMTGTAYDLMISDDVKKNQLLVAWSIRHNWRRLTGDGDHADPRLAAMQPLQGVRVVVLATVILTHAGFVHHVLYVHSPRALESFMSSWPMMIVRNGTALVQVFVALSSFLLAYSLLQLTHLSYSLLPKILLLRYIRLAPVHLLVVGFAATWWGEMRDGPMWPLAVRAEAAACRRKFWTQALYIHNLVEPEDRCFIQTWYLAVDMQLHVVGAVLTLGLHRWRHRAVPILSGLFLASCALNGILAYVYRWKTMLYIMTPENIRTSFRHEPSFWWFYASSWGSLPACLVGLIMANVHHSMQEKGVQAKDYKWLRWLFHLYFPLALCWVFSGAWLLAHDSRLVTALHAALERPVFTLLSAVFVFGLCNGFEGPERALFAWRGWRALGRLSLGALALHWSVNMLLAAARPLPVPTAPTDVTSDFLSTLCVSYLLATPLHVLVELPLQRVAAALAS